MLVQEKRKKQRKLDLLFDRLCRQNIFARQNYWCCQGCGCSAAGDDRNEWEVGYVFYHEQDKESFDEHGNVYLSYGYFNSVYEEEKAEKILKYVTAVLEEECKDLDIPYEWDGTYQTRFLLFPDQPASESPQDGYPVDYELSENQRQFVADAWEQHLEIHWDYSGRGMYGRKCPGVVVPEAGSFNTSATIRQDSMGLDVIIYAQD